MKPLKTYINEVSILGDIEDTLNNTDSFINEFETIKTLVCNPKSYYADRNRMYKTTTYRCKDIYKCQCENLIKILFNINNCDKMSIEIKCTKNTAHSGLLKDNFSFKIYFHEKNTYKPVHSTKTRYLPFSDYKTFDKFINNYVAWIFTDLNAFENILKRDIV